MPRPTKKYKKVPGQSTLYAIRKRILRQKPTTYFTKPRRLFFDYLIAEKLKMEERGRTPRHVLPIFVSNAMEMIALLPPKDSYRRYLVGQIESSRRYELSSDKFEIAARTMYLKPKNQGGKRTVVWFIHVGGNIHAPMRSRLLRLVARKMADQKFDWKVTARMADRMLKDLLVFK